MSGYPILEKDKFKVKKLGETMLEIGIPGNTMLMFIGRYGYADCQKAFDRMLQKESTTMVGDKSLWLNSELLRIKHEPSNGARVERERIED